MAGAANESVYMDVGYVAEMVQRFKQLGSTLRDIAAALNMAKNVLRMTAFFGGVGAAAAQIVENFQKSVEQMANKMMELSGDVDGALRAFRDGDATGSQRFT
jgi:hypothetical protein